MFGDPILTWLLFLFGGAVSGGMIAYAMDLRKPKELLQGVAGGVVVAVLYLVT